MIDDKQWIRSLKKNKNKYELELDTSTRGTLHQSRNFVTYTNRFVQIKRRE